VSRTAVDDWVVQNAQSLTRQSPRRRSVTPGQVRIVGDPPMPTAIMGIIVAAGPAVASRRHRFVGGLGAQPRPTRRIARAASAAGHRRRQARPLPQVRSPVSHGVPRQRLRHSCRPIDRCHRTVTGLQSQLGNRRDGGTFNLVGTGIARRRGDKAASACTSDFAIRCGSGSTAHQLPRVSRDRASSHTD
jgi:hypothetical protein